MITPAVSILTRCNSPTGERFPAACKIKSPGFLVVHATAGLYRSVQELETSRLSAVILDGSDDDALDVAETLRKNDCGVHVLTQRPDHSTEVCLFRGRDFRCRTVIARTAGFNKSDYAAAYCVGVAQQQSESRCWSMAQRTILKFQDDCDRAGWFSVEEDEADASKTLASITSGPDLASARPNFWE